jgi:predicted nucleic acid-binding protein
MLIMPDSSAWIAFLAGVPGPASDKLGSLIQVEADVCVCGSTVMEVLRGLRYPEQHRKVAATFQRFEYLEERPETFKEAANIYRTCRENGFTIRSSMDCLIAALSLQHGAYLLHNDRDFGAIAKFFPLKFF